MNCNIRGDIELCHLTPDGGVKHYKFANAIMDYGLEYMINIPESDPTIKVEEMILSDGDDIITDSQLNPNVNNNFLSSWDNYIKHTNSSYSINSASGSMVCRGRFIRPLGTMDLSKVDDPVEYREISLMVAHPSNIWDGEYKAVFAKAKIKDSSGNPIAITMQPGDVIEISYTITITLTKVAVDPAENNFLVSFDSEGVARGTTISSEVIRPKSNKNKIVVNFTRKKSTYGDFTAIQFSIFRCLVNGDIPLNVPYHITVELEREVPITSTSDDLATLVTATKLSNTQMKISGPANIGIFVYNNGYLVSSLYKSGPQDLVAEIPTWYVNKFTGTRDLDDFYKPSSVIPLDDSHRLDVFASRNNGDLVSVGTVISADTIAPVFLNSGWVDANNFQFYTDKVGTITYTIHGGPFTNLVLPPEWLELPSNVQYTDWYGEDYLKWSKIHTPIVTLTSEMILADDVTNYRRGLVNINIPFDLEDWNWIVITATDAVGNATASGSIYSNRVDYQDPDFIWDGTQQRTLKPTGEWNRNTGYDYTGHYPVESVTNSFSLINAVIEDIPNEG